MKVQFTRKSDGSCDIKLIGLTQGKSLALCTSLAEQADRSIVTHDIVLALRRAVQEHSSYEKADADQELFEALGE